MFAIVGCAVCHPQSLVQEYSGTNTTVLEAIFEELLLRILRQSGHTSVSPYQS